MYNPPPPQSRRKSGAKLTDNSSGITLYCIAGVLYPHRKGKQLNPIDKMRLLQSQQSQNDVAEVSQPVGGSSGLSCYERAISASEADNFGE